jgi:hypothetical protein
VLCAHWDTSRSSTGKVLVEVNKGSVDVENKNETKAGDVSTVL